MAESINGIVRVEHLDDYSLFDEIIDVRSPGEFADDHLLGAINCPVLDDEQRAKIGTLYKERGGFEAKRIGAADVAENIARHLREAFKNRPKEWKPLVLCWRGGQRSGAMTLILRRIGWDAQQLIGGYKRYRKQVIAALETLPAQLKFTVIAGATGSGKSQVLQALAGLGEQVLDLEALASHKGSVLGVLPDVAQPSQKFFETKLVADLRNFDSARPVYVESESRKLGALSLPNALLAAMREAPCIQISATQSTRVAFLLRDYAYFLGDPEHLTRLLDTLSHLLGEKRLHSFKVHIQNNAWEELVSALLEYHYDPLYRRSQSKNYGRIGLSTSIEMSDLNTAAILLLADQIRQSQQ